MCVWPLPSTRGNAIRALFTLYGSSLNVNTNTGKETRPLRHTGRPEPFDILTCYIISWGYSVTPISLRFLAGTHLSNYIL